MLSFLKVFLNLHYLNYYQLLQKSLKIYHSLLIFFLLVFFTGAQKLNLKAATLPRLLGEVL